MKMKYAGGGFFGNSQEKFSDMAGAGSGINMAYANRGASGGAAKVFGLGKIGGKGRALRKEKRYLKKLERQGKLNDYGPQSQDRLDYLRAVQKDRAKKIGAGVAGAAALGAGIAFGPAALTALKGKAAAKMAAKGIGGAGKSLSSGAAQNFGANAFGLKSATQGVLNTPSINTSGLSPLQTRQLQAGLNAFTQGQGAGQGAGQAQNTGRGYGLGQFLGNAFQGIRQGIQDYNAADPALQGENGVRLNKRRKRKGMNVGALAMLLNQAQQARDIGGLKMRVKKAAPRRRGSSAAGKFYSKRAR
jgi:hypothetical protein